MSRRRPTAPSSAVAERDDRQVLRQQLQQALNNEELK